MRGGIPVRVSNYEAHLIDKPTGNIIEKRRYSKVTAGMIGDCGHEHPTPEDAEQQCLAAMMAKYREARWPKKKA
jgi:hypothetical protein